MILAMLGTTELLIVLAIVVIFFGLGKLPMVGKQLGEGIKNFKQEMNEAEAPDQIDDAYSAPRDVTEEHVSGAANS